MKLRRVLVTLELGTCEPLSRLQATWWWSQILRLETTSEVLQAQANVIRKAKRKAAKRKRPKSKRKTLR